MNVMWLFSSLAHAHGVPVVLVIYDTANSDTATLCKDVIDQNSDMSCDLSDEAETGWDGTNPSLSSYDVVLHMTGTTGGDMPAAGQSALVSFVQNGGGYIHFEYAADEYDSGNYSSMRDLILFDTGTAHSGSLTWTEVSAQAGHRVLYNVGTSFSFNTEGTETTAHSFSTDPVTVLMTDSNGADAVAIRELGTGRVVGFNTAGNAGSLSVLADANVEQIIIDAILWAGACDEDVDGHRSYVCYGLDCDDNDASVYWGATELCNSIDDDCDLQTDESATDASTWYSDDDGDGYGDVYSYERACSQPSGFVENYDDCDDGDATIYPGADEYCDTEDDDCDNAVDESGAVDAQTWFLDSDSDSHGDASQPLDGECTLPSGYSEFDDDCDDSDPDIYPGATEVPYDSVDQDCDGSDLCDVDKDGFDAEVSDGPDCNDQDPYVHPNAIEIWYDGVDQDCDQASDNDAEQDGFDSKTYGGTDCDDADDAKYPGAPDDPYDGVIHDCDETDEFDGDADGHKSDQHGGDDCDDASSDIHPGATEFWYDGVDQDCDQASDYDADRDLYDSKSYDGLDCDDGRAEINPGAEEIWGDGIDQDCDGLDVQPEAEDTEAPVDTGKVKEDTELTSPRPTTTEQGRCAHSLGGAWLLALLILRVTVRG